MPWRERIMEYSPFDQAKRAKLGELVFDASPHDSEAWDTAVGKWTPIAVMWVGLAAALFLVPGHWWTGMVVLIVAAPVALIQHLRYPRQDVRLYARGVHATFGQAEQRFPLFRGAMQMAFRYEDIESVSWPEPGMLVLTVPKKNKLRTTSVVAFVPESRRAETARLLPELIAAARSARERAEQSRAEAVSVRHEPNGGTGW